MGEEDKELEQIRKKKLQELKRGKDEGKDKDKGASGKPIKVTDETFPEIIAKYPLVVIDCWAPWCGPCNMVAPILDEIAKDYADKIVIGKLNVDNNQKTAMQYGIMSIPAMLIFKNGKLIDQVIGAMPKQLLEPKITKHL